MNNTTNENTEPSIPSIPMEESVLSNPSSNSDPTHEVAHGNFILDTQTGEVRNAGSTRTQNSTREETHEALSLDDSELSEPDLESSTEHIQDEPTQNTFADDEQFSDRWNVNLREMADAYPDLHDPESELRHKTNEYLNDPRFMESPDGILAAVQMAAMSIEADQANSLKQENQSLKAELSRLNRLTQPSASGPTRQSGRKPLTEMTTQERESYLRDLTAQYQAQQGIG